jgi:hypothetical protein
VKTNLIITIIIIIMKKEMEEQSNAWAVQKEYG